MTDQNLIWFRKFAIMEGWSFLVLLFIAMPIKYGLNQHWPVKIFGWVHGVLFIAYMLLLALVFFRHRWSFLQGFLGFIAAFIPFGPFIFHRKLNDAKFAAKTE